MNNFAVYILTYGRAEKVITYNHLREQGYTGKIYLICSDDDSQIDKYKEIYGNDVIVFSKDEYDGKFDIGDNFTKKNVVVYARNAVFDIAERMNTEYFLVLDDDYQYFKYVADKDGNYKITNCKNLDKIFKYTLDYYKSINALSIAYIQGGDLIGGKINIMFSGGLTKRKVMNTFFCSTKRRFNFVGRINEDATTYTILGTQGHLFLQIGDIKIDQLQTQSNSGGLTEFYLDTGTYYKSFYSVMYAPSCVKISSMGNKHYRIHHRITNNNMCSCILNEKYKKK